jgi:type IV secretion system protein VirB8
VNDIVYSPHQPELEGQYAEVTFEMLRRESRRDMARIAWTLVALSLVTNITLALCLVFVIPALRLIPLPILLHDDGTMDTGVTLSDLPASTEQAVIHGALWHYVKERESYSYADARDRYDTVSLMSSPAVKTDFQAWFIKSPDSPQRTVGQKGQINVQQIGGILPLREGVVLVRFRRTIQMYGGDKPAQSTWSATLQYQLANKMTVQGRHIDPSGVVVTRYQASEDTSQ